ncbi:hypothetical protein [Desulfobacca acetoxidans]|uniref:Uncharacterized protein n=1 Tax=Desulfobacca acetoxidans (strain ATCC 700848 / DSM 11109 / ASRB2) TaxID=880072 RepID=F2NH39_DESAR|nr:hypothetical protein [Desulfobacca acetoxidans]AEB08810.1 hypothetical protein Desac_0940 [Desulfobacca acetoxidans DSM 11109]
MTDAPHGSHHWQIAAFPLMVYWRQDYRALSFYFPDLQFGRLEERPEALGFSSMLQLPRQGALRGLGRAYHTGELRQWQAYLDFLASHDKEEDYLKEAIRGQLAPVLPKTTDPAILWPLAHQLEQMLAEKEAGMYLVGKQQQALAAVLGPDLDEEGELAGAAISYNPSLRGGLPDPELARVRLKFWQAILTPCLKSPWAALVLETAASDSSPRCLWEEAAAAGGGVYHLKLELPDWHLNTAAAESDSPHSKLQLEFRQALEDLLTGLSVDQEVVREAGQAVQRLVQERLWPASGLPPKAAVWLELFGWQGRAPESELLTGPMMLWSRA